MLRVTVATLESDKPSVTLYVKLSVISSPPLWTYVKEPSALSATDPWIVEVSCTAVIGLPSGFVSLRSTPGAETFRVPLLFARTKSSTATGGNAKRAMQLRAADITTLPSMQSGSPLHPAKMDPVSGVAVNATT